MPSLAHLVVIPCPNGRTAAGAYRYSIYLAPRLRETGTLNDYELWRNWGQRAANLQFRMFNGNSQTPNPVTIVSPAVDPNVWATVFGSSPADWNGVKVEPFAFVDRADANFFDFQSTDLNDKLGSLYESLAGNGDALDNATVDQEFQTADLGDNITDGEQWLGKIGNDRDPLDPPSEFHQALRYLSSHPDLMRRLGLIFDIEVNLPLLASPPEMQIRTNYPNLPVGGPPINDFTSRLQVPCRMRIDGNNHPEVRLPDYRTGRWVNFDAGKYKIAQGSTPDLINSAASLQRELNAGTADAPPAITESGISVSNVSVKDMLVDQLTHSAQVEDDTNLWLRRQVDPNTGNPTSPPVIYAEDVAIGVRWDAEDVDRGTYRSLHERQAAGGYDFPRDTGLTIVPPQSEGWSSLAISTDGTEAYDRLPAGNYPVPEGTPVPGEVDKDTTDWRVDGSMLLWDGWSLSVPRPGQAIDSRGRPIADDPNVPRTTDPAQVAISYQIVPGTLERLRFDHTYRFRGRCVDLCGNSEPPSATSQLSESQPIEFGRTTPIPPPTVVRRSSRPVPGYGDQTTTLVIKSELKQPNGTIEKADRMLFTPRIPQLKLERHGLPAADGIDIADYQFIADRDARTLDDQLLVDPTSGETVAGAAIVDDEVTSGPSKQVAQYMPDPATDGVAFHNLPKGRPDRSVVMKTGNWPNPQSVILELAAGSRQPGVKVSDRRVIASLPQGTIAECSTSSTVARNWLDHFKYFDNVPSNQRRKESVPILAGQNVMYSPRQTIKLVHAVRVPLLSPSLNSFRGDRTDIGQTTTIVEGSTGLHRDTTDRIVIPCTWDGPDLRTDPSGLTIGPVGGDILTDAALPLATNNAEKTSADFTNLELDLLDTKRHNVTLTAQAFCRFSEYFYERVEIGLTHLTQVELDARGFDPMSVRVTNVATGDEIPFEETFGYDAVAGTITPNLPGGTGTTNVEIDYIPLPVSRLSAESKTGKQTRFTVLSSAPPPPPVVTRVLPAYSRTVSETASRIIVNHDGRVIRVHMEAPWNASGEGEELGVAAETDGSQTQWGRDATVVAAGTRKAPLASAFKKAVSRANNVDGGFDVAGHAVAYDAARNLITSDVQVNATFAYRPFVRLSLCRYQPLAVNGAHVSTTVATDTIRIGAARKTTVQRSGNDRVRIQMVGPDNVNEVTVRVEEADPAISDDDLRWQDTGTAVVLRRAGNRRNARFTGTVNLPSGTNPRRVIVEDAEPVQRESGGSLVTEYELAYREVVDIPTNW